MPGAVRHNSKAASWSESVYRVLLFLYPAEFRLEYGTNMVDAFRDRRAKRVDPVQALRYEYADQPSLLAFLHQSLRGDPYWRKVTAPNHNRVDLLPEHNSVERTI